MRSEWWWRRKVRYRTVSGALAVKKTVDNTRFQRYVKPKKIKEPLPSKGNQRLVNLNPFFVCMYLQRPSVKLHYLKWQSLRVSKQNFWQRCSLWKYYIIRKIYLVNIIQQYFMKKRFTALLPNPAASLKKFGHIKLSIFMTILKYAKSHFWWLSKEFDHFQNIWVFFN